jgi:hypothetical protein
MMAWLLRLIGGWIPIGTKPFPEWLGKILWAVGIFVVCSIVMAKLFPEKAMTNVGKVETQIINQAEPRDMMGVGCNFFRAYIKAGVKG